MSDAVKQKELEDNKLAGAGEYRYGFHTDIAEDKPPKGLNETVLQQEYKLYQYLHTEHIFS